MKMKLSLITLAGVLLLLGLPGVAQAQCDDFESVVPDGRVKTVTIPFNGVTGIYVRGVFFVGAPGRSYSVQVFGGEIQPVTEIFVGAVNTLSCLPVNAAAVRETTDIEPRFSPGPRNKSFTFTATAPILSTTTPFFITRIRNFSTTTATTVDVKVTDTTLFSPRWSTFGGFYTTWGIQNTTNASCSVTLTVKNTAGTTVASPTFAVAAGAIVFRDTRPTDLNVAANQAGQVILTHDCPPGGIQADGFMTNEGGAVFVTIPVLFTPVRETQ